MPPKKGSKRKRGGYAAKKEIVPDVQAKAASLENEQPIEPTSTLSEDVVASQELKSNEEMANEHSRDPAESVAMEESGAADSVPTEQKEAAESVAMEEPEAADSVPMEQEEAAESVAMEQEEAVESLPKEETGQDQNGTLPPSADLAVPEVPTKVTQPTGILPKHAPSNEPRIAPEESGAENNSEVEAMAVKHWRKKGPAKSKKPTGTKATNDMVDQLLLRHVIGRGRVDSKMLANLEFESAFEKVSSQLAPLTVSSFCGPSLMARRPLHRTCCFSFWSPTRRSKTRPPPCPGRPFQPTEISSTSFITASWPWRCL